MTLDDLIQRFRALAKDTVQPYLWADEDVAAWLSDAEREAAIRGRLLFEDDRPEVCLIAVLPGQRTYPLHPKLYEIVGLRFQSVTDDRARRLQIVSREWLDNGHDDWHGWAARQDSMRYAVQDERSIRLIAAPVVSGVLTIEGYRLPMRPMEDGDDKPEIHEAHHEHLVQWALHKAFSVADAEAFDSDRSLRAERAFTEYFGLRPDSDLRRSTRIDVPQTNTVYLP